MHVGANLAGGLPAWLFENGSIPIRTYAEPYISFVDAYWQGQLLPLLKKHLYSAGGNVVMVQMENEYGSYGDVSKNPSDLKYMQHLISIAGEALGVDAQNEGAVILFTTDVRPNKRNAAAAAAARPLPAAGQRRCGWEQTPCEPAPLFAWPTPCWHACAVCARCVRRRAGTKAT